MIMMTDIESGFLCVVVVVIYDDIVVVDDIYIVAVADGWH